MVALLEQVVVVKEVWLNVFLIMKKQLITIFLSLITMLTSAQSEFDKLLNGMYKYTVPLVKSDKLVEWKEENNVYILDTRESAEYKVSHIQNAIEVGYDNFELSLVKDIPKNAKLVVYCSVGYRSERIGEKLINEGYISVFNLYGGIFDWVNSGNPVFDADGKVAKVHAYNKDWGKWVEEGSCKKVY